MGDTENTRSGSPPGGDLGSGATNNKFAVPAACILLGMAPVISFLAAAAGTLLSVRVLTAYVISEFISAAAFTLLCLRIGRGACTLGTGADATGLLTGVATAVCFYPASILVSEIAGRLFPSVPLEESLSGVSTGLAPWLLWILMALLPAVSEELLCRGVVFGAFRKYGAVPAILVSAAGFACMHGSVQQAAYTFLMGAIWACLRECTGSVAPGIISHLVFNTAGVMVMLEQVSTGNAAGSGFLYSYQALAILTVCCAAGGIALLRVAKKRFNPVPMAGDTRLGPWPLVGACIACVVNIGFNVALSMA